MTHVHDLVSILFAVDKWFESKVLTKGQERIKKELRNG